MTPLTRLIHATPGQARVAAGLACAVLLASLTPHLSAQPAAYPHQPVKLLVGFAAGGPSDLVARAFSDQLGKAWPQPVLVENRPGANAVLATEAVAGAKADGHTLLAAATNHTMVPALYGARAKFDALKSFAPVCTLASSATVLVLGPALPVKTLDQFMVQARARRGQLSYGSPGQGSSPHLATEQFSQLAGVSFVHIPYKGAAPMVTDLLGGQLDLAFATLGSVLPHLKSGKLHALAVASRQRSALVPDVPTFEEAGLKGYTIDTWYGLLAPAGTPPEVLRLLVKEAQAFAQSPAVRERLATAGLEPSSLCGDAFAVQLAREVDNNTRLARALNLKLE